MNTVALRAQADFANGAERYGSTVTVEGAMDNHGQPIAPKSTRCFKEDSEREIVQAINQFGAKPEEVQVLFYFPASMVDIVKRGVTITTSRGIAWRVSFVHEAESDDITIYLAAAAVRQ